MELGLDRGTICTSCVDGSNYVTTGKLSVHDDEEDGKASSSSSSQPSPPLSRIGLNDHKAGMEGLNKEKINQVILEASKGSKYYENEVRKEEQVTKKIKAMLENLKKVSSAQKLSSQQAMDREIEKLECNRSLNHIIVHIDMDAFYASVEMRDNPRLRDVPMAVGSYSMLSTSNYVARRFGVRAAMPGFIAKKLCPKLVIVQTNFDKYRAVSKEVQEIVAQYDPHFSPMGLDESYLDLTDYVKEKYEEKDSLLSERVDREEGPSVQEPDSDEELFPWMDELSPAHWRLADSVVAEIRSKISTRTGLTASAGIASNMMLAKVASDMNKPNGQYTVDPTREGTLQFVQQLPIRKICGIGKVTERMLKGLGVTTCEHLYEHRAILNLLFSPTSSHHFLRVAMGIGSTDVHSYGSSDRKSMSTERTFAEISKEHELLDKCTELCKALSEEMIQEGVKGRTVTLKIKKVNFEVRSHAETVPNPVCTSDELFKPASQLLKAEIAACKPNPLQLRLMGVRVSMLQHAHSKSDTKQKKLTNFFQAHSTDHGKQTEQSDPSHNASVPLSTDRNLPGESSHERCEEAAAPSTATCPVCNQEIPAENITMNKHIDECLSQITIEEVLSSKEGQGQANSEELSRVASSPAVKRVGSPRGRDRSPNYKKRRVNEILPTLETFWK